jgi:hypothetical protein
MVATTHNSLTIRTAVIGNQPTTKAGRFGLGLVVVEPPAEFLSQGQFSLPRLSVPDQTGHRNDMGDPDMRYPLPSEAPASSVGSFSGATVCRSVSSIPTNPKLRTEVIALRGTKELALLEDMAPAADLESKLNPFSRSCDCQSPRRGKVHQRDIPTFRTGVKSVGWSRVAADAATHAAK